MLSGFLKYLAEIENGQFDIYIQVLVRIVSLAASAVNKEGNKLVYIKYHQHILQTRSSKKRWKELKLRFPLVWSYGKEKCDKLNQQSTS